MFNKFSYSKSLKFFRVYFILLILISSVLSAQRNGGKRWGGQQTQMRDAPKIGIIFGTVVDSASGEPVPYASVSVINERGGTIVTGGITKENGEFHIKEIPLGRHSIVVEYIGYAPKKIGPLTFVPFGDNVTTHNLETISLVQKVLQLGEVDVMAERPMFIQTAQKRVFSAEKNTLSTGGSAIDVLRQVPGVEVDMDDNVSLRGSSQVNIMIDGKPSTIAGGDIKSLLQSIPSANIADIEVMTNPGAKYDPEGMAGIINIVLKENKFAGFNGNLNTSANSRGGSNVSGQVNWRTLSFNTFANVGIRQSVREFSGDSYRIYNFDSYSNILEQDNKGKRNGENLFLKTGFEYFIDPTQSLALSATINGGDRANDDLTNSYENGLFYSEYYRDTDGLTNRGGYDLNINYDKKYKNPKQKLTSYISYSLGGNDGSSEYWTTPRDGFEKLVSENRAKNGNEGQDSNFDFKTDYVHPFENGNIVEVGFNNRFRSRDDSQLAYLFDTEKEMIKDESLSNQFLYDENINAAYLQYSTSLGILGMTVGARYENVSMSSKLINTNQTFENPYKSFFPSLSLSAGSPQLLQVQASYSKRVNRPRSRQLNPFTTRQDLQNIRRGNPFLKPEYIDSYEVNIGRFSKGFSITGGPYYRYTTDKIQRHKELTDSGVSIATYENISKEESKGLEYTLIGSLGRKFRLMFSGSIYWDEINTDIYGEDYNKTAKGQRYNTNLTWNINSTTELMFFMFYRPAKKLAIGEMGPMSFSALSMKKKLLDEKLNVSLRVGDPFDLTGFHFELWGDNWSQVSNRDFFSRAITLSFEYKFGKIEDRSRYNRNRAGNGQGDRGDFEIF